MFTATTPAGLEMDQLFVNGKRQSMARYPNYDEDARPYNGAAADAFSKERAAKWADPAGGYIHAMHRAHWGGYHYRITGKKADGTNSGVIVHCSDTKKWIPNSVEVQIADDFADKWAKSPKTWQCAAIFGHLAPGKSAVKKPGEWNRFTITCQDRIITVVLNGEQVTTMDMSEWTSAKKNPDGSAIPGWLNKPVAGLAPKGHIGFQGKHAGAPIYFRNIKIKPLAAVK